MSKKSAYFKVDNITGNRDIAEIKKELDVFPGVMSVSVNAKSNRIAVDFDSSGVSIDRIENGLRKMGYEVIGELEDSHG